MKLPFFAGQTVAYQPFHVMEVPGLLPCYVSVHNHFTFCWLRGSNKHFIFTVFMRNTC